MFYHSTRNVLHTVSSRTAILQGIAPDGGLYLPDPDVFRFFPWASLLSLSVEEIAAELLRVFIPDLPDPASLVAQAWRGRFETSDITPLKKVGSSYVLELFHGPTAAFKDVALTVLPRLLSEARRLEGIGQDTVILTATSGDTGKAALEGFRDVPGTRILVFYPQEGVSSIQRAQMITQEGGNLRVCAVRGNFDDAQSGVKQIFSASKTHPLPGGMGLSSANSINIGRLIPQIVYYFKAYADLLRSGRIRSGDPVVFTVPTGNFGNILAGFLAMRLGLPIRRLVCASNANNVLTDFLRTGRYDRRRPFHRTTSPSMDILVSSNLERLLFLLSEDAEAVSQWMSQLQVAGAYEVSDTLLCRLQSLFWPVCCDDVQTEKTIASVYRETGYLCDPHTAVAFFAAENYGSHCGTEYPNVILSTASPYKFPVAVLRGLGHSPVTDEFAAMEQLEKLTGYPIPASLRVLSKKPVLHSDVIDRQDMEVYVREVVSEWNK